MRSDGAVYYQVSSLEDLLIIIKHLDKYPLITHKWADFELFKLVVNMMLNKEHLTEGVKIVFKVTQDLRNKEVLAMFESIFSCGKVYKQSPSAKVYDFLITGLSDILKHVIPFFLSHPLEGAKHNEFLDFIKVAELMKAKAHLNEDGLEQIRLIKSGMNRGRELPPVIEPVLDEE